MSKVTAVSKGFTAAWTKQATQTTGYQIQYSLSSTFASGNKTALITPNTTLSKKITGLTAKKKYYVRVRTYKTVGSTKYYSAWSKAVAVTTKA
jgi:Fibronectin type III domain.